MEQHLVRTLLYLSAITSWNANSHLNAKSGSNPIQKTIQDRPRNAPNIEKTHTFQITAGITSELRASSWALKSFASSFILFPTQMLMRQHQQANKVSKYFKRGVMLCN